MASPIHTDMPIKFSHVALVESLQGALNARACLYGQWQAGNLSGALIVAPEAFRCLFEMDAFPFYFNVLPMPLQHLGDAGFLAKRRMRVAYNQLQVQIGHDAQWWLEDSLYSRLVNAMGLNLGQVIKLSQFEFPPVTNVPVLEAGPLALARSTHQNRQAPANAMNVLLCLSASPNGSLLARASTLQGYLDRPQAQADKLNLTLVCQALVNGMPSRLAIRTLREHGFSYEPASVSDLLGAMAYASWVVTDCAECCLLATAMKRHVDLVPVSPV